MQYGNYDAFGRPWYVAMSGAGRPDIRLEYTFDIPNPDPHRFTRTNTRTVSVGGQVVSVLDSEIDPFGRVIRQIEVAPDSDSKLQVDYDYNKLDQFLSIVRQAGSSEEQAVVAQTDYQYDPVSGLIQSINHERADSVIQGYDYAYDPRGRLTAFTTQEGTTSYTHDDFGQLTRADHQEQADESYGYDNVGNRTNPGYQTGKPNLLWTDGRRWFDYDANGNRTAATDLVTGDVTRYHYDHIGRLIGVEAESADGIALGAVGYDYDVFGRRISRVEWDGQGAVIQDERWAHEGDHVLLKFGPTGAVIEQYLYGPQTDQLLAVTRAGAGPGNTPLVLWTLSDHQGTVRDVIDSTGAVRKHWAYDSFGNVTATSGDPTLAFDHLYTGREYDATTGLYFYRARWYDPAVGRFISRDPLGLSAGDPNTSGYVFNSPMMNTDPSGTEPVTLAAIGLTVTILALKGAIAGATVGAVAYGISSLVSGESPTWSGFGKAVLYGGLSGAAAAVTGGFTLQWTAGMVAGGSLSYASASFMSGTLSGGVGGAVFGLLDKGWYGAVEGFVFGAVGGAASAGVLHLFGKYYMHHWFYKVAANKGLLSISQPAPISGVLTGWKSNVLAGFAGGAASGGLRGALEGYDSKDPLRSTLYGFTSGALVGGVSGAFLGLFVAGVNRMAQISIGLNDEDSHASWSIRASGGHRNYYNGMGRRGGGVYVTSKSAEGNYYADRVWRLPPIPIPFPANASGPPAGGWVARNCWTAAFRAILRGWTPWRLRDTER